MCSNYGILLGDACFRLESVFDEEDLENKPRYLNFSIHYTFSTDFIWSEMNPFVSGNYKDESVKTAHRASGSTLWGLKISTLRCSVPSGLGWWGFGQICLAANKEYFHFGVLYWIWSRIMILYLHILIDLIKQTWFTCLLVAVFEEQNWTVSLDRCSR